MRRIKVISTPSSQGRKIASMQIIDNGRATDTDINDETRNTVFSAMRLHEKPKVLIWDEGTLNDYVYAE